MQRLARPEIAVGVAVALTLVAYSVLASVVESPRIFTDELAYWNAASSLTHGDLFTVRGERYALGPLYPALLALVLFVAPDREVAYELAKQVNALLFVSSAIPIYLLSRLVLRRWWSVGVAVLGVVVPSSMYVSVVMTESAAYLSVSLALLAIARALDRTTAARQWIALSAIALASGVRLQFLVLFPAYLAAVALVVLLRGRAVRTRSVLRELWPTSLVLAAAIVAISLWGLVSGAWAPRYIGDYSALVRTYDVFEVGRWLLYHLANLDLYLAVIPFAVAPIVLVSQFRCARNGSTRHAAFLSLFVCVNTTILVLAAGFNSTEFAHERLHDRYTFYLVPLWLIVLLAWAQDGAPRPFLPAGIGAAGAVFLPLFIPYSDFAREDGAQRFAGVGSTLWAAIQTAVAGRDFFLGKVVMLGCVAALVLAVRLLPRRLAVGAVAAVVMSFLVTSQLAWYLAVRDGTNWAFASTAGGRRWVDRRTPPGRSVTTLTIDPRCAQGLVGGDSFHRTEFFNASITGAAHVGRRPTALPSTKVHIGAGGTLRLSTGAAFRADYVLALDDVSLDAERVATGTVEPLSLWDVGGPVRIVDVEALRRLSVAKCRPAL